MYERIKALTLFHVSTQTTEFQTVLPLVHVICANIYTHTNIKNIYKYKGVYEVA